MKFRHTLSAGLASLGLLLTLSAQEITFPAPAGSAQKAPPPAQQPAAPAAPAIKYTEAQVLQAYGWLMGARSGLAQLEFSPANAEDVGRGLSLALQGKTLPFDAQAIGPEIESFLEKKSTAFMNKLKQQGMAETSAYLAKLKENKSVLELPSGLRYEIVTPGKGVFPKPGQTAKVKYSGAFVNGQKFDDSEAHGGSVELILQEPSEADPRGIIGGMAEGMQKINPGGKIRLHIPPWLAYGDEGVQGGIPPAATLVFDIELLEVKDTPKYVPPAPPAGAGK